MLLYLHVIHRRVWKVADIFNRDMKSAAPKRYFVYSVMLPRHMLRKRAMLNNIFKSAISVSNKYFVADSSRP